MSTAVSAACWKGGAVADVLLQTERLTRRFGGVTAADAIALTIAPNEVHAIIGPNGAGKTTLIGLLSGEIAPQEGSIRLAGAEINGLPVYRRSQLGLARSFQITSLFRDFTALDNVALAATFGPGRCPPSQARDEARAWLDFTGLGRRATALPHELNLHERKFLELARALAGAPRVILLDEVLSGLNPAEIASAVRLIQQIRARGVAVLFVEHLMRAVLELSDRVVVLNEGEVIAAGSPHEAMRSERVIEVYLGTTHVA